VKKENFNIGVWLILAAALTATIGQLLWKIGTESPNGWIWYILGFIVAGSSAILMMLSFRFGEVSILQPLMSVGYVFSILLGYLFLGEPITLPKLIGTVFVIIGAMILAIPDHLKKAAVVSNTAVKRVRNKAKSKTTNKISTKKKSKKGVK